MPRFRSRLEGAVAATLTEEGVDWQYEVAHLGYQIEHLYTPDFMLANGIFLEVKGYFSPEDRRKMLAVKKAHPQADIRLIFSNPNQKISKTSRTSYADWCIKKGFPYCSSHSIPLSWLTPNPSPLTPTQTSSKKSTSSSEGCLTDSPPQNAGPQT